MFAIEYLQFSQLHIVYVAAPTAKLARNKIAPHIFVLRIYKVREGV